MSKLHIKKGDTVYVNAGEDKGKTGRVLRVLVKEQRAVVEGINMVSKHTKPNAKHAQGGIITMEAPVHVFESEPARSQEQPAYPHRSPYRRSRKESTLF